MRKQKEKCVLEIKTSSFKCKTNIECEYTIVQNHKSEFSYAQSERKSANLVCSDKSTKILSSCILQLHPSQGISLRKLTFIP